MTKYVTFNETVTIMQMEFDIPVLHHAYDKLCITINNDGLVELWNEEEYNDGIFYDQHCGWYTKKPYQQGIAIGRVVEDLATYKNHIWTFHRHNSQLELVAVGREIF